MVSSKAQYGYKLYFLCHKAMLPQHKNNTDNVICSCINGTDYVLYCTVRSHISHVLVSGHHHVGTLRIVQYSRRVAVVVVSTRHQIFSRHAFSNSSWRRKGAASGLNILVATLHQFGPFQALYRKVFKLETYLLPSHGSCGYKYLSETFRQLRFAMYCHITSILRYIYHFPPIVRSFGITFV